MSRIRRSYTTISITLFFQSVIVLLLAYTVLTQNSNLLNVMQVWFWFLAISGVIVAFAGQDTIDKRAKEIVDKAEVRLHSYFLVGLAGIEAFVLAYMGLTVTAIVYLMSLVFLQKYKNDVKEAIQKYKEELNNVKPN